MSEWGASVFIGTGGWIACGIVEVGDGDLGWSSDDPGEDSDDGDTTGDDLGGFEPAVAGVIQHGKTDLLTQDEDGHHEDEVSKGHAQFVRMDATHHGAADEGPDDGCPRDDQGHRPVELGLRVEADEGALAKNKDFEPRVLVGVLMC